MVLLHTFRTPQATHNLIQDKDIDKDQTMLIWRTIWFLSSIPYKYISLSN